MKRGCTQCGECLNVCPVYALFKREEYAPKGKRLLLEAIDPEYGGSPDSPMPWEDIRELARLCAGCERCQRACARKLSTCDLLAEARSRNPHWTQALWDVWIRRVGPLWPMAGKIAMFAPDAIIPGALRSSVDTARALVDLPPCEPWVKLRPAQKVNGTKVALFSGCTAKNARPRWIAKAHELLEGWGYELLDTSDFACCGGTLHHAGQLGVVDGPGDQPGQRHLARLRGVARGHGIERGQDAQAARVQVLLADAGAAWALRQVGRAAVLAGQETAGQAVVADHGQPLGQRQIAQRAVEAGTVEQVVFGLQHGVARQALRGGHVRPDTPNEIQLFAGAGIVADSDPAVELAETGAKFIPMLQALGLEP